jgi:hypothetical protein
MDGLDLTFYAIGCLLKVRELNTEDGGEPQKRVKANFQFDASDSRMQQEMERP